MFQKDNTNEVHLVIIIKIEQKIGRRRKTSYMSNNNRELQLKKLYTILLWKIKRYYFYLYMYVRTCMLHMVDQNRRKFLCVVFCRKN